LVEFESPEIEGRKVYDFGSKRNTGRLMATVYSRRHCNTSIRSSRWLMNLRIMESGGVSISAVGGYVARIWMKKQSLECATLA